MRGDDGKTRMKFYQISSDEDQVKEPRCMWPLFFSRAASCGGARVLYFSSNSPFVEEGKIVR